MRDFSMSEHRKFYVPFSMMMYEIGDDEYMDKPVGIQKPSFVLEEEYGYYTDTDGKKRFGLIPKGLGSQFNFKNPQSIDYLGKDKKLIFLNT